MASSYLESMMSHKPTLMTSSVVVNKSDAVAYEFKYSNNWFQNVKYNLHHALVSNCMLEKPLRILEIGTFEGQSTLWFLTTICTHALSHITTIDLLSNNQFLSNVSKLVKSDRDKLTIINDRSANALKQLSGRYDIIYIDGSHFPDDVLEEILYYHFRC